MGERKVNVLENYSAGSIVTIYQLHNTGLGHFARKGQESRGAALKESLSKAALN